MFLNLSRDLDVTTSPKPAWFVSFESNPLDVPACQIWINRSYRNGNTNSYIKSYTDTLENAELTASIRHITRFLKSGIPIYNSEVPNTIGRKTRRRKTRATAKHFAFHANAIKCRSENHFTTAFHANAIKSRSENHSTTVKSVKPFLITRNYFHIFYCNNLNCKKLVQVIFDLYSFWYGIQ